MAARVRRQQLQRPAPPPVPTPRITPAQAAVRALALALFDRARKRARDGGISTVAAARVIEAETCAVLDSGTECEAAGRAVAIAQLEQRTHDDNVRPQR